MKTTQVLDEKVLVQRAVNVLMKSLGPVETTRFLSMPAVTREDSVRRHRRWQAGLDQKDFFKKVFNRKDAH